MDDALKALVQRYVLRRYGRQTKPGRLVIDLDASGRAVGDHLEQLPLALLREFVEDDQGDDDPGDEGPKPSSKRSPAHTPDFASVFDGAKSYTFSTNQRTIVQILWQMREQGTPNISAEYLLEESGSASKKLSEVFRGNSAWNQMIVAGPGNTYYLRFADDPEPAEAG